jgi:hypothetical protein
VISDVLFGAVEEIEDYERQMPDTYGEPYMKVRLQAVKDAMRGLQRELDTPPQG